MRNHFLPTVCNEFNYVLLNISSTIHTSHQAFLLSWNNGMVDRLELYFYLNNCTHLCPWNHDMLCHSHQRKGNTPVPFDLLCPKRTLNKFLRKSERRGIGCRREVQGDPTLTPPVVLTGALIPQEMPPRLPQSGLFLALGLLEETGELEHSPRRKLKRGKA